MYSTSPMYVTSSATGVTMSHPSQLTTFPPPPLFANNPANNLINGSSAAAIQPKGGGIGNGIMSTGGAPSTASNGIGCFAGETVNYNFIQFFFSSCNFPIFIIFFYECLCTLCSCKALSLVIRFLMRLYYTGNRVFSLKYYYLRDIIYVCVCDVV